MEPELQQQPKSLQAQQQLQQQMRKQLQMQQQPPQQTLQEHGEDQQKLRMQVEEDLRREFWSIASTSREIQEDANRFLLVKADAPAGAGHQTSRPRIERQDMTNTVSTTGPGMTSSRTAKQLMRQASQPVTLRTSSSIIMTSRLADDEPSPVTQDHSMSLGRQQSQGPGGFSPDSRRSARSMSPVQRRRPLRQGAGPGTSTSIVVHPGGLGMAPPPTPQTQSAAQPNIQFSGGGWMQDFVGTSVLPKTMPNMAAPGVSGRTVAAVPGTPPAMPPSTPIMRAPRASQASGPDAVVQAAAMAAMAEAAKRVQLTRASESRAAQVAREAQAARAPDAAWPEPVHSSRMRPAAADTVFF